ncbi:hypothetical protein HKX48_009173 [Thoreauomyces humboldtii]|nr:hypothetical protein HKX48_009173 [Thoreauomyces humboldtii]
MPLYLALLMSSGILAAAPNRRTYTVGVLFMFASGIYSQGAGFHSAAVMFKHPLKLFMDDQPGLVATYPFFSKYYAWQRTTWEHTIAHYLYALGGILISIVVGYAHRHTTDAKGMSSRIDRCMFVLAVVLYALIMGSVAIEFPKGSIVALCLIALGTSVMGTWVVRRDRRWRKAVTWGNRYVLQFYFAAYCGALVIVVAWIAHAGGFVDREDAGITF